MSYHNREFTDKMKEVGLQPSSTGKPGGAEVGQTMADYPIPGGKFLGACDKLLATGFAFSWGANSLFLAPAPVTPTATAATGEAGASENAGGKAGKKVKYTCPKCNARAWGKSTLNIVCGDCNMTMKHAISEANDSKPAAPDDATALINALLGIGNPGETAAANLLKIA